MRRPATTMMASASSSAAAPSCTSAGPAARMLPNSRLSRSAGRAPLREHDHADGEGGRQHDADGDVLPDVGPAQQERHEDRRGHRGQHRTADRRRPDGHRDGRAGQERVRQRLPGVGQAAQHHQHSQQPARGPHQHRLGEGALQELVVQWGEQPVHVRAARGRRGRRHARARARARGRGRGRSASPRRARPGRRPAPAGCRRPRAGARR